MPTRRLSTNTWSSRQTYTLIGDNHTQSYTIQLAPGIKPYSLSVIALDPLADFSDQDMAYAFDYGDGRVMGVGLDIGNIDYATGKLTLLFGLPPLSTFPIKISYSVGETPLTTPQLRGLLVFQTKGRCVNCHGGPELSNASVGTVSTVGPAERMIMADMQVRVYDTGYYHIGVRPTAEDGGLAGSRSGGRRTALAIGISAEACLRRSLHRNHDPRTARRRHLHGATELRRRNGARRLL